MSDSHEAHCTGVAHSMPDVSSILARRIAAEVERSSMDEPTCREMLLHRGLDTLQRERQLRADSERLQADVVLVTATKTERKELLQQFVTRDRETMKTAGRISYRRAQIGSWRVAAIHVEIGLFGARGAVTSCGIARDETLATLFVGVGTAFGVPSAANIGDVLVSDAVLFYDDRRVVDEDGAVVERVRRSPQEASRPWVERMRERVAHSESGQPRIVVGTLLSGGAVLESPSYRDQLVRWHSPTVSPSTIVGGEMEAAGLVAAAGDRSWIVVKGVSDWADGATRRDPDALRRQQQLASRNAAITILEMLAETPREVDTP